jgi:peptidyl-prolyl cis-trans isomerase SurA
MAWTRLIDARYGGTVNIPQEQIDLTLQRIKEGADKPQFQVSEIFLGLDRPEQDAEIRQSAEQIVRQLNAGAVFPNVARQFSQAASAASGGDIGWVQQGQLPAELDNALKDLQPGQVAGPIKSEGGYYLILLRDRREPAGTPEVREPPPPDPNAPLPLDRFLLPLPFGADDDLKKQATDFAVNIRAQLRSCDDLATGQTQEQGSVLPHLGTIQLSTLAEISSKAILATPPGGVTEPIVSPAGVELIMRCDPPIKKVVPFVVPTRDEVAQQLYVQQMTVLARSYLRDLRRDAVVETR